MESLKDAIVLAVAWEKQARDNYTRWADETTNLNAKKLFMNLAKMEEGHIRSLKSIDLAADIKVSVEGAEWLDLSQELTSFPTSGDRYLNAIFEYAIAKENTSFNRYLRLSSEVPPGKLADIFKRLMNEEEYSELHKSSYLAWHEFRLKSCNSIYLTANAKI